MVYLIIFYLFMSNTNNSSDTQNKENFSSLIGFIATTSASAVGLGNIWKFSYEVGKHGGALFLIMYIAFSILLGFPLVLAELSFGRFTGKSLGKAYHTKKEYMQWNFLGNMAALTSFLIFAIYTQITGWILSYTIDIISGKLFYVKDFSNYYESFVNHFSLQFFYTTIIVFIVVLINRLGIQQGIERVCSLIMPIFLFMLIGLVIYAILLPGSGTGISFYLFPRWGNFTLQSVVVALSQSFLSLSIGSGILITYGSYVNKKENLVKSSAIITFSDTFVSFLMGCFIFPFVFFHKISPASGSKLIFIVLPQVLQKINNYWAVIIGLMFFSLLLFASITSAIALFEVILSYLEDKYEINREESVFNVTPAVILLTGITIYSKTYASILPFNLFDIIISLTLDWGLPIIAFLFSIFLIKVWKIENFIKELEREKPIHKYMKIYLQYVLNISPFLIGAILVFSIFGVF